MGTDRGGGSPALGLTTGRALLSTGNLWHRQGIAPGYPQGSSWGHVSNNVRRVSTGPLDQVWGLGGRGQALTLGSGP